MRWRYTTQLSVSTGVAWLLFREESEPEIGGQHRIGGVIEYQLFHMKPDIALALIDAAAFHEHLAGTGAGCAVVGPAGLVLIERTARAVRPEATQDRIVQRADAITRGACPCAQQPVARHRTGLA